ncbi:MAG: mechanosensitive ion channel family protein [Synergistes sp.]|nr:mechanosensitive ion channel family protein [Synergistes sp.]MCR5336748.1 mechanosensitive ion channel family protein [Synergistes sp.]
MEVNLEKLPELLQNVTYDSILPALIYLVAGFIIVQIVMKAISGALSKSSVEKTLHRFILRITKFVLYFVLFMTVAAALGIQITSFVALLSVAGLALSLSLQGILANFASGIILLSVKPFRVGDYVVVGGSEGVVNEIDLMYTKIITLDNKVVYVPNSQISSSTIQNYSGEDLRRVDLTFNVAYSCPPADVKAAITEAVTKVPNVLADPEPFVRVSGYKESTVEYTLRVWCKNCNYWDVYFDSIETVPQYFEKYGVRVTYPHLNVHVMEKQPEK